MRTCPHCGARITPLTGPQVDDFIEFLATCRDAIDRGHVDLARAVVHLLIEHKTQLGLRARNLARQLAEQVAERERPAQQ